MEGGTLLLLVVLDFMDAAVRWIATPPFVDDDGDMVTIKLWWNGSCRSLAVAHYAFSSFPLCFPNTFLFPYDESFFMTHSSQIRLE